MQDQSGTLTAPKTLEAPWKVERLPKHHVDDDWPESVVVLSLHPNRAKGEEIVVRPSRAYLRKNRRLLWLVNAAPGDQVLIKFKQDNDPPRDPGRPGDR